MYLIIKLLLFFNNWLFFSIKVVVERHLAAELEHSKEIKLDFIVPIKNINYLQINFFIHSSQIFSVHNTKYDEVL